MKIVYLDCFSGIAGDMTLAALVDAGADKDYVEQELAKLPVDPFTLRWTRVTKRGVSALKLDVLLDEANPPKHHRHYKDIAEMIVRAGFSEKATALALSIFEKIAIAEAKIHDVPVEQVHFHEVGAIDSIVDVIGVALALDSLDAEKIISSPVPLGSGSIRIDHGLYPVPAPATLEMMRGLPVAESRLRMELTTPTGAGIIAGTATGFLTSLPSMIVDSIGYGAGTRDLADQPNVLRVVIGHTEPYLDKWHSHHELHHIEHVHEHAHHHHHHGASHEHHHGEHSHHGHSHSHPHDHVEEAVGHETPPHLHEEKLNGEAPCDTKH
ncbi:LarC family nickel insertion protein [Paenibacillus sp. YN15]|uniref:LarC family nickel insertion protein n=1 Tax=Paenibacillus sp. YN15 TaxID=1742774 RepID=UPI000DCE1642|nr:LarC family nickel insertion protein [Paenibacillus sp. YN15]RAV06295.1 LarC family nickel insertion protein [Paenibacillus sp. YN15]